MSFKATLDSKVVDNVKIQRKPGHRVKEYACGI